jgi:hypothetical protein
VAVARKLSVLLHRLWVSAEIYEPLRNTHRRQEQEGGSVVEGRWSTAKHTQEVKILVHSGEATLKWRIATAELARTRFGFRACADRRVAKVSTGDQEPI